MRLAAPTSNRNACKQPRAAQRGRRATPALRSRVAHLVAWSVVEGKIMTLGELDETLKAQVS